MALLCSSSFSYSSKFPCKSNFCNCNSESLPLFALASEQKAFVGFSKFIVCHSLVFSQFIRLILSSKVNKVFSTFSCSWYRCKSRSGLIRWIVSRHLRRLRKVIFFNIFYWSVRMQLCKLFDRDWCGRRRDLS